MKLNPYLNFDGNCAEAFRFYADVLGGELEVMLFRESPMADQVGPEWQDRVVHARLAIGDQALLGSDKPPGTHKPMQGMYVTLNFDDVANAERVFNALAKDGTVTMPLEKTFWAERFGMATDRFGTPWMVNVTR